MRGLPRGILAKRPTRCPRAGLSIPMPDSSTTLRPEAARATMRCCATGRLPAHRDHPLPLTCPVEDFRADRSAALARKLTPAACSASVPCAQQVIKTHKFAALRERYVKKHIDLRWPGKFEGETDK